MNKFIPYILIAWSLLAFVGYDVLTVEATTTAPNQMLIINELYSKYIQQPQQPQQQQQQPQQQPYNNFADFQLFMQFMMYYEQLHGKDYILKIYNEDKDDDNNGHHKHHNSNHHYDQWVNDWIKYQKEHPKNPKEKDFLSPENVDRSITFIGENEPGFIKTPEQKRAEEGELVADLEDDLADANTPKEKERIHGLIDIAKEEFGLDKNKEKAAKEDAKCDNEDADTTDIKLCMSEDRKNNQQKNEREWYYNENTNQYEYLSDEEIKEHNMESESEIMQGENWGPETPIEPPSEPYPTTEEEVIEDWSNTVSETEEEEPVNTKIASIQTDSEDVQKIVKELEENNEEPETSSEEATEQEEDDNQVNTDTEDNTDSSDSQDSSDSEDNSSDDGGDSLDSSDDSSSSDDGGDSGDSSESEE